MNNNEATLILEDVLDVLVEVGNGVTDEMLHEAADKLFKFRDEWFKPIKNCVSPYRPRCKKCDGSGEFWAGDTSCDCPHCKGTGIQQ